MPHTWKPSVVASRIYDLIKDNSVNIVGVDGQVFYGDQSKIAVTPTVCVESGVTDRALAGVAANAGRTENELTVWIICYFARVQDVQANKLASEQVGEAIVTMLDTNSTLARSNDGGIVIHGFVTQIDPGYARRGDTLFEAVRLRWTGKSKMVLGA